MEEASRWESKSDLSVQVSQSIVIDCSLLSNPFHRDLLPSGTDCLPGNYCQVDPIAPLCHSNTRNLVLIRWMSNGIRAIIYFVWHHPSSPSPSLRSSFPTAAGLFTFFGMAKQPSYRKKRLLLDALWLRKLDMNIMPISRSTLFNSITVALCDVWLVISLICLYWVLVIYWLKQLVLLLLSLPSFWTSFPLIGCPSQMKGLKSSG